MAKYKVVAVIWDDHVRVSREDLPIIPEEHLVSTISFGVLVKKTKETLVVVSDLERFKDHTDSTYMIIIRKTVRAIKEYGEIEIENL